MKTIRWVDEVDVELARGLSSGRTTCTRGWTFSTRDDARRSEITRPARSVPPAGQAPQIGDVILLPHAKGLDGPKPYRVVDRELLWLLTADAHAPSRYGKMWIHVHELSPEEYQGEPPSTQE